MRAVVQRVREASVTVEGNVVASCGAGVLVLVGVATDDELDTAARLADRVARLRIFENDEGRFDRSLLDVGGQALVVSQFTLIANTRKGNGRASPTQRSPTVRSRWSKRSRLGSRRRAFVSNEVFSALACRCLS